MGSAHDACTVIPADASEWPNFVQEVFCDKTGR